MSDDDYGLGLKVHEDAYRELEEQAERYRLEANAMMLQRDRLIAEREQWRMSSVCRELREQRDRLHHDLKQASDIYDVVVKQRDRLAEAALAVVDRWETPFWKQVEHTGVYIAALRKAVEEVKGGQS